MTMAAGPMATEASGHHVQALRSTCEELSRRFAALADELSAAAERVRAEGVVPPLPDAAALRDDLSRLRRDVAATGRLVGVDPVMLDERAGLQALTAYLAEVDRAVLERTRRQKRVGVALAVLDRVETLQLRAPHPQDEARLQGVRDVACALRERIQADPEDPAVASLRSGDHALVAFLDLVAEATTASDERLDELEARVVDELGKPARRVARVVVEPGNGCLEVTGPSTTAIDRAEPPSAQSAPPPEDSVERTRDDTVTPPRTHERVPPEPLQEAESRSDTPPLTPATAPETEPSSSSPARAEISPGILRMARVEPISGPPVVRSVENGSSPAATAGAAAPAGPAQSPIAAAAPPAKPDLSPAEAPEVPSLPTHLLVAAPARVPPPTPRRPLPREIPLVDLASTAARLPSRPQDLQRLVDEAVKEGRLVEAAAFAHVLREQAGPGAAPDPAVLLALVGQKAQLPAAAIADREGWYLDLSDDPGSKGTLPPATFLFVAGVVWDAWPVRRLTHVMKLIRSTFWTPEEAGLRELLVELVELASRGLDPGGQLLLVQQRGAHHPSAVELMPQLERRFQLAETTKFKNSDCRRAWKQITRTRITPLREALAKGAPVPELRALASKLDIHSALDDLGVEGSYQEQMETRAHDLKELVWQVIEAQQTAVGGHASDEETRQRLAKALEEALRSPRWGEVARRLFERPGRKQEGSVA